MLKNLPIRFLAVVIMLAAPTLACTQPPRFTLDTPKAIYGAATLVAVGDAGVEIADAGTRRVVKDWIELRQENRKLPALLGRNFILLTNGDRLPLDPEAAARLDGQQLHIWPDRSWPAFRDESLSIFAPNVVLAFWSLPEGVDGANRFFLDLARQSRKRDVAFLKNGDRIEGTLQSLEPKGGCVMATSAGKVSTPWSKLAGLAWNTDRQARLRARKPFARAVLDGGARVNLVDIRFENKSRRWQGKTQFGAMLDLPEANLFALQMRQAHAVDLSALTPTRYEQRPYLGAAWPLDLDTAIGAQPLRVDGSTYEKGLGIHGPCRVTYALDGKYQRFDAVVGIDPAHARRGRVRIALEVDGKRIDLNAGKEITSASPPLEVRQDVRAARTLTLIVDLGTFGDVHANVNWANARLVKSE